MIAARPAPKSLLLFAGVAIVLWSAAAIPLSMTFETLFTDYPMAIRLAAILALASAVAAPLLLIEFRRWRLVVWIVALVACVVIANLPWSDEKAFYLRAERIPPGASVDEVKARMSGYRLSNQTPGSELDYDLDGNFAAFTFHEGRLLKLKLIPD